MHPVASPWHEAVQLYVAPSQLTRRLAQPGDGPLRVYDVGLGAGSNACAAIRAASGVRGQARALHVLSFDRSAQALALVCSDEHAAAFGLDPSLRGYAARLLRVGQVEFPGGCWQLCLGELPQSLVGMPAADVVFWDPFSPRRNRELWSVQALSTLRQACGPDATFHTYSGATATRSALLLSGFFVGLGEVLGGGKRATEASVARGRVREPLGPEFLSRLERSSAPFPADAPADALRRLRSHPQF